MARIKTALFILLTVLAVKDRTGEIWQSGKDADTYEEAIITFLEGRNPYHHTVISFQNTDDVGGHGFAYPPGFLYLFGLLLTVSLKTGLPTVILWKLPVLVADLGIGILLYRHLARWGFLPAMFGTGVWLFNPYFKGDHSSYSLVDPIPILFVLLALLWLNKDDVLTGAFYTLSIMFKPFAIVLFPLFLIKAHVKIRFIAACAIVFFILSLPFLVSVADVVTYLQGALLVHSNRVMQGRPFLFYLSYYYHIELIQIIPLKVYSTLATFFSWIVIGLGYKLNKIQNKYILAALAGANFLLFTPVLNRTYLLWFLPIFILALHHISARFRRPYLYYGILSGLWLFFFWYLSQWKDGFHVWHP